jgi:5-methylcytosine-specific restriction endonuclease McrA
MERAGGRCEVCGETSGLELHHLNGDATDNRDENLALVCRDCHAQAHRALRDRRRT